MPFSLKVPSWASSFFHKVRYASYFLVDWYINLQDTCLQTNILGFFVYFDSLKISGPSDGMQLFRLISSIQFVLRCSTCFCTVIQYYSITVSQHYSVVLVECYCFVNNCTNAMVQSNILLIIPFFHQNPYSVCSGECNSDYVQFGRDILFITSYRSNKYVMVLLMLILMLMLMLMLIILKVLWKHPGANSFPALWGQRKFGEGGERRGKGFTFAFLHMWTRKFYKTPHTGWNHYSKGDSTCTEDLLRVQRPGDGYLASGFKNGQILSQILGSFPLIFLLPIMTPKMRITIWFRPCSWQYHLQIGQGTRQYPWPWHPSRSLVARRIQITGSIC